MTTSSQLLATLSPMDYPSRISRLRESMPDGVDAMLITHLTNVRYLTGYTGSNGTSYITKDEVAFITDGRYRTQSHEEIGSAGIDAKILVTAPGNTNMKYLGDLIETGITVGLEADTLSWSSANSHIEAIGHANLVPTSNVVEDLRLIKQTGEVDRIRAACRIADEALLDVMSVLKEFPTEKEFARILDRAMIDRGAQANSFDTIVACGPRGALPHAQPTDAKIEANQMIVVDFGCIVDGYCSDMTRTLSVGELDTQQQEMWDQVIESQRRGREFAKPGVTAGDVDAQCRDYLEELGVAEFFAHGTGHGVGLDIHEAPRVGKNVSDILEPGYIVTVEPGIYFEGTAGVRIEDTLCITADGAEVLTSAPKELLNI